jgi:hypothetical protein
LLAISTAATPIKANTKPMSEFKLNNPRIDQIKRIHNCFKCSQPLELPANHAAAQKADLTAKKTKKPRQTMPGQSV